MNPDPRTAGFAFRSSRLLAVAVLAASAALAQELETPVRTLSAVEGLSQSTVLSVLEDRSGFVWFGTEDGLNRWDGETVRVYRRDSDDSSSLPSNVVRSLTEDAEGRIWVGTEGGGLARWDRLTDRFIAYRDRDGASAPRLADDYVRVLESDPGGGLWVGFRDAGLQWLNSRTGETLHLRHAAADGFSSLSSDHVFALAAEAAGHLWIGTGAGLDRLDGATGSVTRQRLDDTRAGEPVRALAIDPQGGLWIGTESSGILRLDPSTGDVRRLRSPDPHIRSLRFDSGGRLWVGTRSGIVVLDANGEVLRSLVGRSPGGAVLALERSRDGSVWVGTQLGGASRRSLSASDLGHRRFPPGATAGGDVVTSFVETPGGDLLVGTFGDGLMKVDAETRQVERLRHEPEDPRSLPDDQVMALMRDRRGTIWVGTKSGGVSALDPVSGSFTRFSHDPEDPRSLSSDAVMSLYEDRDGAIWIGTFGGGLNRLESFEDGRFVRVPFAKEDPTKIASPRITTILQAEDRGLWVGTDGGGLSRLDPVSGRGQRFLHDPSDPSSLPADTVFSLFVDADGDLWVGTRGAGLARVSRASMERGAPVFETFSSKDGLPNEVVYGIRPDDYGFLWLSTNQGLSRFDPTGRTFRNFDVHDGLQGDEFNFGAAYRDSRGILYFGGTNGYNAFRPEAGDPAQRAFEAASLATVPRSDREPFQPSSVSGSL